MTSLEEKRGAYPLSIKSRSETNRLDGQHSIFTSRIGGLYRTHIPTEYSPPRVLDVGCGSGIWTCDFAVAHPSSQVVGIDISPPAERFVEQTTVPINCTFVKADFFTKWRDFTTPEKNAVRLHASHSTGYDFIYMRMLMAAVSDWPALLREAFQNLNTGGRLELFEGLMEMNAEDGSTAVNSAAIRWFEMAQRYMAAHNVKWDAARDLPSQLREVGFVNIEVQPVKMKLYRDGDEESWVGKDYARDMAALVDGMSKRLRDESSVLSEGEWEILERNAKRELLEEGAKRGFYTILYIILARSP